ncbi:MAG: hypothetical protein H6708_23680 [Kofleriaceae bacterium]|nr:hypothetical protein [Kofleriaceae bacterium]
MTTRSHLRIALAAAALAVAVGACDEDKPASKGRAGAGAPAGVDAALAGWKAAGLTVSAFEVADGSSYGGGDCKAGTVSGVDTVVCVYATAELAKAAEPAGLTAVGQATGVSMAQGELLLVIADRRAADPQGLTINRMTKLFRGKP